MARALRETQLTPADELRELLAASEKLVVNLRGSGAGALVLLHNLDRIAALWPELEVGGIDLRPEAGRWETLQAAVRQRAAQLLRELRAVGGLAAARAATPGTTEAAWWWRLDDEVRARNLKRGRQAATIAVVVLVIGAAVVFLLNRLFPVDPQLSASLAHLQDGQRKIENAADYTGALANFEAAAALRPNDTDPWLWLGATRQKLGEAAAAQDAFDRARALLGSDLDFRLARVPVYLTLQMLDEAQADLDAALALDPESPQAYLYLATLYELQERYLEAIAALERASTLAEARGQAALAAIARYRAAILIQRVQAQSFIAPSPTPP
jgi:cytochrome c-type biogenesis protein CcmH/NrfG